MFEEESHSEFEFLMSERNKKYKGNSHQKFSRFVEQELMKLKCL